jgi:hypothetical protein
MITEYPLEQRRYDQPEYEPFRAAAEALGMPLSLDTATRRQGRIRGAGGKTLRDASSRATKAVLSGAVAVRSDLLRRLRAAAPPHARHRGVRAGVGAPPALDHGLHLPRAPWRGDLPVQEPALAKVGDGMLPSDFFRRNVVPSFQEDAIGIRLRDVIGVDNMMWGSGYPHSESAFPRSRKIRRRSWPGCRTTNRPSLPRTPIRAPPKRLSSAGRPAAPGTRATPATIWRARRRWRNGRDRCRARNSAPRPRPRSRP